ncbi:MAG TPA: class I SAM-dependent rRNA methyltransferase [Thermoanaerobaculia bacterium]|nr:class I SAM-dependent rRNA methyltransferase [Thermoanaerobaculia bacterium]
MTERPPLLAGSPTDLGPRPEIRFRLLPGKERPLLDGHPWLFSGAIASASGPADAPIARVFASDGRLLGLGFHSPQSQIRARLIPAPLGADRPATIDRAFFAERLAEAAVLRRAVVPADTTGYRILNAEGDGVPGWTVDRFADVLVSQITVAGLEALRAEAYAALAEAYPGLPILQVNDLPARKGEGLPLTDEVIAGEPPAEVEFQESGLLFAADLDAGQKTGFYCDQRENRRRVSRYAAGRSVLDLFAHTGAFGLYALAGGAGQIIHVESSPKAIERGQRLYEANGHPADRANWVKANVFEDLRTRTERYDLVICDPPPLVRKRQDLDAAARAYKDLNRLAFQRTAPGGLLFTFSCSGAVDTKLFRQILFSAAVEAGVRVALLEPLAAAPDHPVSIAHPQGEYLKGWMCMVR